LRVISRAEAERLIPILCQHPVRDFGPCANGGSRGTSSPRLEGKRYDGVMANPLRWQDYIEERPDVMLGKPVFKGTRITVEHVLRELGNGVRAEDLLREHPRLTHEHVRAAWAYGAALIALEDTVLE